MKSALRKLFPGADFYGVTILFFWYRKRVYNTFIKEYGSINCIRKIFLIDL